MGSRDDDPVRRRRLEIVAEHMRCEDAHDFEGALRTFDRARYEVTPTGDEHDGNEAVRRFYAESDRAFPDFHFERSNTMAADDAVVVEVDFVGPATGAEVRYRMCNVFEFEGDRLVCERLHFDLLTILRQLGIARDPTSLSGRIATFANHPITIGRALFGRSRSE